MVNILEAIERFPDTLKKYSQRASKAEVQEVAANIVRVKNLNPPVYNEKGICEFLKERAEHLKNLVDDYFVKSMSHEFPLINEDLFGLKRQITLVKQKGRKYMAVCDMAGEENIETKKRNKKDPTRTVTVSLFAYTPLFEGSHKAKLGSFSKTKYNYEYGYTRRSTTNIESMLPGSIGPNLKDAYRNAMQHYFSTLAEMFSSPVAADIMYSEGGEFTKPRIGAIWIPKSESLNIEASEKLIQKRKNLDPAMVIIAKGKKYLVQTWKLDDEEPFKRYLTGTVTGVCL